MGTRDSIIKLSFVESLYEILRIDWDIDVK